MYNQKSKILTRLRHIKMRLVVLMIILQCRPLILNYQVGKVGSSSISEYLKQKGIREWHIHRFYHTPVLGKGKKNSLIYYFDLGLLNLAKRRCRKIYVITGFREPVARDISMFFQVFGNSFADSNLSMKELLEIFRSEFDVGKSVNWFQEEFNKAFNIDIYDYPFNSKEGYCTFSQGNISFFVYNLAALENLEREIAEFLEIDEYRLITANLSKDKSYDGIYEKFCSHFEIRDHELRGILNSRFAEHFYREGELLSELERWKNKV